MERNDRSVPRIPVDMNKENHVIGEPRIAEPRVVLPALLASGPVISSDA